MASADRDRGEQNAAQAAGEPPGTVPALPPPPVPSSDPRLILQAQTSPLHHTVATDSLPADLFSLPPSAALKLLCAGIESLVRVTGDIPPTPPPTSPPEPNMSGIQREKAAIVRSHSERNLARLRQQQQQSAGHGHDPSQAHGQPPSFFDAHQFQAVDGVHLRHPPTPPPPPATLQPYIVIGENSQPLNLQHSAITRKFFSKEPPPISVENYLQRIHRFCPMSTAVYLATSVYIFRLAVEERAIPVTRRNCHRLLLAGLRVAMKALEDLSYSHAKISRVGGVSEAELARLEISFCFLAGFELVVDDKVLSKHLEMLRRTTTSPGIAGPGMGMGVVGTLPNLTLAQRRDKKNRYAPEA
ncbi:cyclin-domain-containing protein [Xylaria palmicola]|nr:cyclin-domain-containing protein [Xylaria palmicola]